MSMKLTIYIGPFLQCRQKSGADVPAYELTDGRLCDLRGELRGDDGEVRFIGPNVNMPNLDRQLRFDAHRDTPVLTGIRRKDERAAFFGQFEKDIRRLKQEYTSVTLEWGVVPGVS